MATTEKVYLSQILAKRTTKGCAQGKIKLRSKESQKQEGMVIKDICKHVGKSK